MCTIASTVNLGCATNTNLALNNNKYYAISNGGGMGVCYVKRFLKDEEKAVLCDLGYSVNAVFGSTVAGSNYTYTSACSPVTVWGINDGLVNGACTYSALITATNAISVPITGLSGIMANDSPNTSTISCLEVIQSSAFGAVVSGTNLVVTNFNQSIPGLAIIKYLPTDAGNNFGSPTYIFVLFYAATCAVVDPCKLVQNGNFESSSVTPPCGNVVNINNVNLNNINC